MGDAKKRIETTFRYWYNSHFALVLESVFIGLAVGVTIAVFRFALGRVEAMRLKLYDALPHLSPLFLALWILALAAVGLFLGWASGRFPMIRGSGIPQVKGALMRKMTLNWAVELPMKIICGLLGLGAGLSMGREGPCIQIGAYMGKGVLSVFRRPNIERRFLVLAASAAGVAGAFNAPLASLFFVAEEMRAELSPLFLACAMGSAVLSDAVAGIMGEPVPVFNFREIRVLPYADLHWVLLLGILCGLLGAVFKRSLYTSLDLYDRLRVPPLARPVIPLLLSVPLAFFLPDITGGGQSLILSLSHQGRALSVVVLLLAAKIAFTALCYGSGTAGGIFLPFLACGALTGVGLGETLSLFGLIDADQSLNFLILGMAAFFTSVVGAPLTGIVLILEMTANFNHMGNLLLVCFASFVTANLIGSRPVYTVLLERMIHQSVEKEDKWL
jgi:H+/Cl- antiporter ClcA